MQLRIAFPRVDVAIAAAVVALGQIEVWLNGAIAPKAPAAACELVLGVALVSRRRLPLLTVAVVSLAAGVAVRCGQAPAASCSRPTRRSGWSRRSGRSPPATRRSRPPSPHS